MSDLRLLPSRARLDNWVRRIRHTHDLGDFTADGITAPVAIVLLPTHANIPLPNGGTTDAWVSWQHPTVHVLSESATERVLPWRIQIDRSREIAGEAHLTFAPGRTPELTGLPTPPEHGQCVQVEVLFSTTRLARRVASLATDGIHAQFEAVEALTPYVTAAVRRKNVRVAAEVIHGDEHITQTEGRPPVVIDAIREEEIVSELCFGKVGQSNAAVVFRTLSDAATGDRLANAPIHLYLRGRIDSAAETAIRNLISDPHLGRRLRRGWKQWIANQPTVLETVQAEEDCTDLTDAAARALRRFIDDWNTKNPTSRIGTKVAFNALTASHDALVDRVSLGEGLLLDRIQCALAADDDSYIDQYEQDRHPVAVPAGDGAERTSPGPDGADGTDTAVERAQ